MLDIVPRDSVSQEIAPISKAVATRQESAAIVDLHAHYSRDRNGFSEFSEELFDEVPMIHLVGFMLVPMIATVGVVELFGQSSHEGISIGFLTAAGALAASYGSMLFLSVRAKIKNRRALAPARAEAKELEGELAGWLKRDYDLTLSKSQHQLPYLAKQLLGIEGRELDPTDSWTFNTATGAAFEARIVQREDGSLELHRPAVAELGEESLIQPLRKGVEL